MYGRPDDLGQALRRLASHRPALIAGGTDYFPARVGRPPDSDVLDLSGITALRGIVHESGAWRIGALTTWTDVVRAGLPPAFDVLVQAALEIGGLQVQNRGTVGGNLCNASPAADGMPALLALDASVELASLRGTRVLPLEAFVLGPRRTALAPDELLVALRLPAGSPASRSRFLKLGARRDLVISIAMVAVAIDVDAQDRAVRIGIAVGACGPVARRLAGLEAALLGTPRDALAGAAERALVDPAMLAPLSPIDDVRGSAGYRLDAVTTLVPRAFAGLAS
ncbi:MAG: FAD binding domain-containing protein [Burkholderiaceae bacterium]